MKKVLGYSYLFKNIGLLTLSSFASKLLSFLLVPLYTSILTTSEYGTYDLFNATIGILLPILTLNIQESVIRFSLDKRINRESIVTISTKYLIISNLIVVIGLAINQTFWISETVADYSIIFFLMFLVQSLSGIMCCYMRGIDKVSDLSISSVIATIVTLVCNVIFLVIFKWGLIGYFVANIIGPAVQCFHLIVKSHYISEIRIKKFSSEDKAMTAYSKPLIVNSIAWWVNGLSDRYVIVFFCGLAENGVYSVAAKIPSILNIFQSIFNQAWTLSAVRDFDPEDKKGFFSNTYSAYNCIMVIICSGIILIDKILAHFLYAKDFYEAWKYVPWLTIAILFGALSGYIGGFFSAVKDSKIFAISTFIGALVNIALNLIFTPIYGAMGASVATAICYIVVWAFRFCQSKKYIKLRVNIKRDVVTYILLCVQAVFIMIDGIKMYAFVGGIFIFICLLYYKDIKWMFKKIIRR